MTCEEASDTDFALNTTALFLVIVTAVAMLPLGCNRAPANWQQTLKAGVIGDWEQAQGSKETLHFNSDGTLIMDSPSEHHNCRYDFPDYQHIRLDCAPPGIPSRPESWKISVTADILKIGDDHETGTYKRKL